MDRAIDIEATLMSMANPGHVAALMRFFKTGVGEYGEGDRFIGLTNPQVRQVVKFAWKTTSLAEAIKLVESSIHEIRLCGLLIMVEQYLHAMKHKDAPMMQRIFDTYISQHEHINNWDLVDLSAIKIVGNHEVLNPEVKVMDEWIKPDGHTMWQQRISMVSTWMLSRYSREDVCFERAKYLIDSPEDLLHKAAGWMLREVWKRGFTSELQHFLDEHVAGMPAIMLSYACEKMPLSERHYWQQRRKVGR